jgi:hypothetical protein
MHPGSPASLNRTLLIGGSAGSITGGYQKDLGWGRAAPDPRIAHLGALLFIAHLRAHLAKGCPNRFRFHPYQHIGSIELAVAKFTSDADIAI